MRKVLIYSIERNGNDCQIYSLNSSKSSENSLKKTKLGSNFFKIKVGFGCHYISFASHQKLELNYKKNHPEGRVSLKEKVNTF